jgi:tryptophanyl-tRNA synthetase
MKNKKYLYGIQPTGRIHIGNYLGGLKKAIELKAVIMIAHYHAKTKKTPSEKELHDFFINIVKLGSYPIYQDINSLYYSWDIQCVTPMSDLKRMTQFKEKGEGNVGLFTYPCLMAADIILSECDTVIVGEDQLQHMEFYRRTCKRLNIPKIAEILVTETPRIMSIKDPTKKMSKSLGDEHCLYLFDDEENAKKIQKAPTTPKGIENIKQIAKGFGIEYDETKNKESKERLIQALKLNP